MLVLVSEAQSVLELIMDLRDMGFSHSTTDFNNPVWSVSYEDSHIFMGVRMSVQDNRPNITVSYSNKKTADFDICPCGTDTVLAMRMVERNFPQKLIDETGKPVSL